LPLRALIFDMDGLLVDSEGLAALALERFLADHGKLMLPGTMERTLGRRLPEAIAVIAEAYELPGQLDDLVATYGRLRLEALRGNVRPMPGAVEIVRWGRDQGLKLALATSSLRSHADLSLAESGLHGMFDAEATGAEVARGKPEPDIFLLAAERLDVDPAACAVLEDAPAGLAAAAAAGMAPIWVPNAVTRDLAAPVAVAARCDDLFAARAWLSGRIGAQA
jgi:HAD superfamily hydrolase (TIGR01509 family)